jgi:hypothetical protein
VLLAVIATPGAALAQPHSPTAQELETARTLHKEGMDRRAKGDLRGAIEKLEAAHALGRTPVTGIDLARTYVMVGQIVEARETALSIARLPVADDETERSRKARSEAEVLAEELRPRIPTLLVHVTGLVQGEPFRLLIDDVPVPPAAVGELQKVDPGRHEMVLRAGEGAAAREVRGAAAVKEGESVEATLELPAPRSGTTAESTRKREADKPASAQGGLPVLAQIGLGTAIAGGLVGLISGTTAVAKRGVLTSECPNMMCDSGTPAARDLSTARSWALAADVSFGVGLAGAAIAVVSVLTTGRKSVTPQTGGASVSPWMGLGAAGVHGSF